MEKIFKKYSRRSSNPPNWLVGIRSLVDLSWCNQGYCIYSNRNAQRPIEFHLRNWKLLFEMFLPFTIISGFTVIPFLWQHWFQDKNYWTWWQTDKIANLGYSWSGAVSDYHYRYKVGIVQVGFSTLLLIDGFVQAAIFNCFSILPPERLRLRIYLTLEPWHWTNEIVNSFAVKLLILTRIESWLLIFTF